MHAISSLAMAGRRFTWHKKSVLLCLWICSIKCLYCEAFGSLNHGSVGDNNFGGDRHSEILVCPDYKDDDGEGALRMERSTTSLQVRGGDKKKTSSMISVVSEFWDMTFKRAATGVQKIFRRGGNKEEEDLIEQFKTIPIKRVAIPNDSIVPPEVVRVAVKRSGMIGNPLRTDRVQDFAKSLKRWYVRNGYVLHSVTGANLVPETGTAEITLEEPRVSAAPVNITFCKEMIIEDDGSLVTFRQYVEKRREKRSFRNDRIEKKDLNTTYEIVSGKTQPTKIARALRLQPGGPFQWQAMRWDKIASSSIFSKILNVSPRRLRNGSIQLEVIASEPPPRHLEYGIGKSLYSGGWEGEIEFEHRNLLGGGENLGLVFSRGTKDPEPSIRVRYSDDGLNLEGGYDLEVFSDYLGDSTAGGKNETSSEFNFRKGTTFRLRNPISTKLIKNSVASTSFEYDTARTGESEKIGSTTLTLGPFRSLLPFDARSSVVTSMTGGARLVETEETIGSLTPYSSGSLTLTQVVPLSVGSSKRLYPKLALQHRLATSSTGLPKHESKAMGVAAEIRGCTPWKTASSSVRGTTELRFPVESSRIKDSSVVLFADWSYVQNRHSSSFSGKSSVGVGLRKNVQGLPLKYDVCLTNDRKIKTMFGLGMDFEA